MKKIINFLLPHHSKRRLIIKKVASRTAMIKQPNSQYGITLYKDWIKEVEPALFRHTYKNNHKYKPLISIIVPCYNTPKKYIDPLIQSVLEQKYSNWELCLADGSTEPNVRALIKKLSKSDRRIRYVEIKENKGIVGNTNEGIKVAQGDFIAFLDHDDLLSPYALSEVINNLQAQPDIDVFYSDEDKLSEDGLERLQPFFKPDWSPALEEGVNYMTHFFVVRSSIVREVGLLRDGFDGAQDYEFILRVTDRTKKIIHIPKVLYHWRLAEGSTSGPISNKTYADMAGFRALQDHIKRQKIKAEVLTIPELPTNFRLKYKVPKDAKVSIIIPFKDKVDVLKTCLDSIHKKTTYQNYEIILISNNSSEQKTAHYLQSLKSRPQIKIFYWDKPFNYSALNNFGRQQAGGDYLILLNNDTKLITRNWLEELIGLASQPGVGAVGPRLLYPNKKIQHAGIVLGMNTMAGHVFRLLPEDALTAFGRPYWPRNYLAVTGACLAIKTSKYDEVGGLDEKFIMAGNDVAFGITLYEKGYLNVYWPFVQLYHYENTTVGSYQNAPASDFDHSLSYYQPYLDKGDPYFNPNLDLMNEQIAIRSK